MGRRIYQLIRCVKVAAPQNQERKQPNASRTGVAGWQQMIKRLVLELVAALVGVNGVTMFAAHHSTSSRDSINQGIV